MKKILRPLLVTAALVLGTTPTLWAQTIEPVMGLRLSQHNYSFGTARSAALAGAYTSLGADMSSMSINPAGMGMYRSSDFSLTPFITNSQVQSNYSGTMSDDSRTRFVMGSIGAALNIYEGSGTLTSATFGFGYNRLADFNQNTTATTMGRTTTIGEFFAERLYGISASQYFPSGGSSNAFNQLGLYYWGGILAYQTYLLEPVADDIYTPFGPTAEFPNWAGPLSIDATVNPYYETITTGGIGEYTFSGGFNIQNFLYFGFTFSAQDINYRSETFYAEQYNNNPYNLYGMNYAKQNRIDGSGITGKFGAIIQPISNLRIGISVHTPTYMSIEESYIESMGAEYKNLPYEGMISSHLAANRYSFTTPTRLMTGISYSMPGVGLLSFDYERVWYNKMRLHDTGYYNVEDEFEHNVEAVYKAADNLRVGLELNPVSNFFLRGGYAYYGDMLRESGLIATNGLPSTSSYYNITGGVGFRFGSSYLDFTYIYTGYDNTPYDIFYSQAPDGYTVSSGEIYTDERRHTYMMTYGVRF